ncbi:STAS domain-containing protein [Micromonospora polyrhachis]|uniref:Anti-sigma factor antagonist n=1 Tax=Micromonospora polyrhachis TaxID=1282883 RepID=A0A7W7WMS3_9ACTN|nr:STAS domain-containing protein [Micromonospora polyrhachis]MBB4957110.1 anti-anti-sigma factor [Micromonospora polyrhachis]
MTVVPGPGGGTVRLICDRCGGAVVAPASDIRDSDLVWPITTKHGWAGSPFALGPHSCPTCVALGLLGEDGRGRSTGPRPLPGSLRIDYEAAAAVVWVDGDVDASVAPTLRDALAVAGLLRQSVVLDLTDVRLIDSTGLGVLVRAHQDLRQRGGNLCLAAPSRFILTVLHTMRIDLLFPIFGSRRQALDELRGG